MRTRSASDGVEVKSVFGAIVEAVGADVFRNFWLLVPLTMGGNKVVLAGHPRPWEARLWRRREKC